MKLFQRLRLLPREGQRFGFRRTALLLGTLSLLLCLGMGLVVGKPTDSLGLQWFGGLIQASPSLALVWFWNRRAVRVGAPRFWAVWRRPLTVLAGSVLVLLVAMALAYRIAMRQAQGDWLRTEAFLRSKRQPLGVEELLGPAPQAQRNFAEHPLFEGLMTFRPEIGRDGRSVTHWTGRAHSARLRSAMAFPEETPPTGVDRTGRLHRTGTDLAVLAELLRQPKRKTGEGGLDAESGGGGTKQGAQRLPVPPAGMPPAQAVLFALEARKEILAQVADAARRPECRFPLRWDEGPLMLVPHLRVLKDSARLFRYRASARIATGDPAGAAEDIATQFRLSRHAVADPSLGSLRVQMALHLDALAGFWEGLAAGAWDEPRLSEFQRQFEAHRQREHLVRATQGEAQHGRVAFHLLRSGRLRLQDLLPEGRGGTKGRAWLRIPMPEPWLLRNQATHARILADLTATLAESDPDSCLFARTRNGATRRFEERFREGREDGFLPHRVVATHLLTGYWQTFDRSDRVLVATRLAATACALDRHRLAHGTYPETLASLDRRFVGEPNLDPATESPFAYRRNADGTFTLYSLGSNRKDDGGGSRNSDPEGEPDWVWPPLHPTAGKRLF